ncbi:hypothetical protein BC749_102380 [Flavobacterium araucananum]|nr:hypothetical protein BC749_102380 [Flavobacterium araucananum]
MYEKFFRSAVRVSLTSHRQESLKKFEYKNNKPANLAGFV